MKKVAIVDYGMSNLGSVARAVEECGGDAIITSNASDFSIAQSIILPGVGAFPQGIYNIQSRGLDEILYKQVIENGIPFLGICLGMQLLASKGWEGEETAGLGWIKGNVQRLKPDRSDTRIPHIGWNEVDLDSVSPLFKDIPSGKDFYFVHSYHFVCDHAQDSIAHTSYCDGFSSVIGRDNILGVQFHPEKSQRVGFQLIRNFLAL